ncbi:MAG: hypothetical protein AABY00_01390 [Nanoarchaeota archaeon]
MIEDKVIEDIFEKITEAPSVEKPQRYVDYALASSFAHCTCNLTSDEVHGYALIDRVKEITGNGINMLLQDYDGTFPQKEKPPADVFQTTIKGELGKELDLRLLFDCDRTIEYQTFRQDRLLHCLEKPWEYLVKSSGFSKEDRPRVKERFAELVTILKEAATNSSSVLSFTEQVRRRFLGLAGIYSSGVPESTTRAIHTQKLEEDLEAGFPFWRMELPHSFRVKHQSNETTYLFRARSNSGELFPVKFFSNPERFEFKRNGEMEVIQAEESIETMRKGIFVPTISVLNYVSLSPARKKPSNESKNRIHFAGQFMAGAKGYAHELVTVFNKVPGYDTVSLVCAGYDGSIAVQTKRSGTLIGFGAFYPQFGREGIQKSLREGMPSTLREGRVYNGTI